MPILLHTPPDLHYLNVKNHHFDVKWCKEYRNTLAEWSLRPY